MFGTPSYGGNNTAVTTLTVPRPVDLTDGCWVILAARSQDASTPNGWTPPTGFVRLSAAPASLPSSTSRVGAIWAKKVTTAASEPPSYALSGPSGRNVGMAVRFDGYGSGDVSVVGTTQYGGSGSASGIISFDQRTLTAVPAISLIALGAECVAGVSYVPSQIPSGFTTVGNAQSTLDASTAGSRTAIWLGYREEPDNIFNATSGGFSSGSGVGGYDASIRGGEPIPAPPGILIKLGDGSDAYLSYLDGAGVRRTPSSLRVTTPPFLVADMLATPGVTMGHRGASKVPGMPEMSRRGYQYTRSRGYRMQEFSFNSTSDGVFVGVHDNTLNRTSETTGLPNLNQMTWADVQTHLNSLGSGGNPVPYFRLEDFLDEFTPEATVHVDPKFNMAGSSAWLDILDAHGGPDRIVVKYVGTGVGATTIGDAARARGYLTAGYFYETDWSAGKVASEQSHWDILGMEYAASADAWSRTTTGAYPGVRSYGKPVLAHIIDSQAAYDTAQAKIEEGGWVTAGGTWIAQASRPDLVAAVWR